MNKWPHVAIASFVAITPAVLGAVLFARVLATGRDLRLTIALAIGIVCGAVVLAVGRSRSWEAVIGAVAVALIGVTLGFLFDAKWNSLAQVTRQMMEQYGLTKAQAAQQARTIIGGLSLWELVRARLNFVGWMTPLFAVAGAALTIKSRIIARLFKVSG